MRHTLIPFIEKKALRREYYTRLCIVALFVLSIVAIIGAISLIPAFMEASVEEVSQLHSVRSLTEQQKEDQTIQLKDELTTAKITSAGLSSLITTTPLSDAIISIIATRGEAKISSIDTLRAASSSIVVTVQGTAPTRNALLAFKDKIQSTISSATVDLPDEDLTQSKNVSFSFKVTFNMP